MYRLPTPIASFLNNVKISIDLPNNTLPIASAFICLSTFIKCLLPPSTTLGITKWCSFRQPNYSCVSKRRSGVLVLSILHESRCNPSTTAFKIPSDPEQLTPNRKIFQTEIKPPNASQKSHRLPSFFRNHLTVCSRQYFYFKREKENFWKQKNFLTSIVNEYRMHFYLQTKTFSTCKKW